MWVSGIAPVSNRVYDLGIATCGFLLILGYSVRHKRSEPECEKESAMGCARE